MSVKLKISDRIAISARKSRRPNSVPEQRIADITRVAGQLFLRHGFGGVSLEMIVAEAGGSYREIYNEFGGKEALFKKVMRDMCTEILAPLRHLLTGSELQNLPLREALTLLGNSVLENLLAPQGLAFHRLMLSEAPRFPELAKVFYRLGPDSANASLAAFLSTRAQQDQLLLEDFEVAAAIFLDGLVNNLQLKALTGGRVLKSDIENRIRQVVRIFLDGAVRRP